MISPNEQQLEFQSRRGGESQCDRILALLQAKLGRPVPMPELARAGANSPNGFCMVHSRIADLRRRGHDIIQSQSWVDGQCHSFYTLKPKDT